MKLNLLLVLILVAVLALAICLGETSLTLDQYRQAFADPASAPGEILFGLRAPRAATAAMVGAALGLSGAVMQGLLRNPLADPGVLGVSAAAGLGASAAIAFGLAATPGGLEAAALAGALGAGALVARSSPAISFIVSSRANRSAEDDGQQRRVVHPVEQHMAGHAVGRPFEQFKVSEPAVKHQSRGFKA